MTLSQSLSVFGNILCVLLCRVLVQIWSAARTANCCWVSGKRREAARLVTELQGISVVTVPGSWRGLGGGLLASSDLQTQYSTDSTVQTVQPLDTRIGAVNPLTDIPVRRYVELYKGQNVLDVLFVSMSKDMSCVMLVQDVMSC